MTTNLQDVANEIRSRFDLDSPIHVDYPGFISIPESIVNDDTDGSDNVWAVGPALEGGDAWTGQLMSKDGSTVVNNMTFVVYPVSQSLADIADAIYCHGIGDWYVGGGCPNCPVRK